MLAYLDLFIISSSLKIEKKFSPRPLMLLLNAGADVNAINTSGATAAILATENGNTEIKELLLKYSNTKYITKRKVLTNFIFYLKIRNGIK